MDDYLVADAAAEGHCIVLCTRGIGLGTLRVARIDDIEPYLEGRNSLIRKARAELGIFDPE